MTHTFVVILNETNIFSYTEGHTNLRIYRRKESFAVISRHTYADRDKDTYNLSCTEGHT